MSQPVPPVPPVAPHDADVDAPGGTVDTAYEPEHGLHTEPLDGAAPGAEERVLASEDHQERVLASEDYMLDAREVRKVYRSGTVEVEALAGISLAVEPGELVAVMGASGSGKTTLLNCLSGLDEITDGQVFVSGVDIQSLPDAKRTEHRARSMGFVFQSFNLIPVFSAVENVELPLLLSDVSAKEARRRSVAMLERVGLGARLHNKPTELSGGEQQRTTIARALVGEPSIVWADEPTGALDSHTAQQVLDLLWELNDHGQTLMLVTHDPAIGGAASRVVAMRDGRKVEDFRQPKKRVVASR
jgi:putative ABC transport system ATP-binding protein